MAVKSNGYEVDSRFIPLLEEYVDLDEKYFKSILSKDGIIVDLKGMYRGGKMKGLEYWSL